VDGVVIEADDHEFAPVERITPDSTVARTYDDPFPNPGPPHHEPRRTDVDPRAARRADRQVAGMFGLATLLLIGFIVSFVAVDKDQMISLPLVGKIGAQTPSSASRSAGRSRCRRRTRPTGRARR
jgi:hypothetical protein